MRAALDAACRAGAWLALAVTALLFAQWPLRDLVGFGSLQANDLAQCLFALYVALALRHAGVRGAHLVARPDAPLGTSAWRRLGAPLAVLPWALFVAASGLPQVLRSVAALERFPDTFNAGYFIVKLALLVLALALAAQALLDLRDAWRREPAR